MRKMAHHLPNTSRLKLENVSTHCSPSDLAIGVVVKAIQGLAMNDSILCDWKANRYVGYLPSRSANSWVVKSAPCGMMLQVGRQWSFSATDDTNPASHIHPGRSPSAGKKHEKPSVLLVEDNPADTLLIREALQQHHVNCELVVVSDGEQAINLIHEIESAPEVCPSLIVLDLNLPKKSGREVLQRIRESPECSHVPVAILSSSDARKDREEAAQLGAVRYIRKPSSLDEFMNVGEILKGILLAFPN